MRFYRKAAPLVHWLMETDLTSRWQGMERVACGSEGRITSTNKAEFVTCKRCLRSLETKGKIPS